MRRFAALAAAVLCLLMQAAPARAQGPANDDGSMPVTLQVLFPPLVGVGVRPLAFGTIMPGTGPATVLPNTPRGGEWRLTGIRNRKSIDISFALPANLVNPSGQTMPIDFNGNFAGSCEIDTPGNACDMATYQTWNPVTTPSMRDLPERAKPGRPKFTTTDYKVFIGGRINAPANTPAGTYTGTITITVTVN